MSMRRSFALIPLAFVLAAGAAMAADTPGLGQKVSETDLALWDMSIGPDGKGLPPGSGTPAQGAAIYAQKCELCHGKDGYGGEKAERARPPGENQRSHGTQLTPPPNHLQFTPPALPPPP